MKTIIATDPQDLLEKVNQAIADKHDLYTAPFVSFEGLLVQRMVPTAGVYEYQLINADNLDDLLLAEQNLRMLGYDYVFNTILWYGRYLQWMGRATDTGLSVRDAVKELGALNAADIFFEQASRSQELQLVADVREVLHMEPTANGGYLVKVPHPLLGS